MCRARLRDRRPRTARWSDRIRKPRAARAVRVEAGRVEVEAGRVEAGWGALGAPAAAGMADGAMAGEDVVVVGKALDWAMAAEGVLAWVGVSELVVLASG